MMNNISAPARPSVAECLNFHAGKPGQLGYATVKLGFEGALAAKNKTAESDKT